MDTDTPAAKKYIRTLAGDMATVKQGGTPDLAPLDESTSSPIKTYASDFSDQMKKEQASPATVLAAEQDAPRRSELQGGVAALGSSRNGVLYVLAGAVLCIVGGLAAYIAYTRYATSSMPIALELSAPTPVPIDEREEISGVGIVLQQAIEQSSSRLIATGAVRLLSQKDAAAGDTVFSALQLPAPNVLLRNVNVEGTMAGILQVRGSQSPFFILSVASYRDTFSGMLLWEPTMPRDLAAFFPSFAEGYEGQASTTGAMVSTSSPQATTIATVPALAAGFHDEVVNNHDIRAYRDSTRRAVLVYGYWDQATLIIARDSAAFAEILSRLANSRAR